MTTYSAGLPNTLAYPYHILVCITNEHAEIFRKYFKQEINHRNATILPPHIYKTAITLEKLMDIGDSLHVISFEFLVNIEQCLQSMLGCELPFTRKTLKTITYHVEATFMEEVLLENKGIGIRIRKVPQIILSKGEGNAHSLLLHLHRYLHVLLLVMAPGIVVNGVEDYNLYFDHNMQVFNETFGPEFITFNSEEPTTPYVNMQIARVRKSNGVIGPPINDINNRKPNPNFGMASCVIDAYGKANSIGELGGYTGLETNSMWGQCKFPIKSFGGATLRHQELTSMAVEGVYEAVLEFGLDLSQNIDFCIAISHRESSQSRNVGMSPTMLLCFIDSHCEIETLMHQSIGKHGYSQNMGSMNIDQAQLVKVTVLWNMNMTAITFRTPGKGPSSQMVFYQNQAMVRPVGVENDSAALMASIHGRAMENPATLVKFFSQGHYPSLMLSQCSSSLADNDSAIQHHLATQLGTHTKFLALMDNNPGSLESTFYNKGIGGNVVRNADDFGTLCKTTIKPGFSGNPIVVAPKTFDDEYQSAIEVVMKFQNTKVDHHTSILNLLNAMQETVPADLFPKAAEAWRRIVTSPSFNNSTCPISYMHKLTTRQARQSFTFQAIGKWNKDTAGGVDNIAAGVILEAHAFSADPLVSVMIVATVFPEMVSYEIGSTLIRDFKNCNFLISLRSHSIIIQLLENPNVRGTCVPSLTLTLPNFLSALRKRLGGHTISVGNYFPVVEDRETQGIASQIIQPMSILHQVSYSKNNEIVRLFHADKGLEANKRYNPVRAQLTKVVSGVGRKQEDYEF